MRRFAGSLAVSVLLAVSLTACGGDEPGVAVEGEFGQRPEVEFPKGEAPPEVFQVETRIEGSGREVGDGDLVVADYAGYVWKKGGTSTLIGSSYQGGVPSSFPTWNLVKGLKKALVGAKVGSRVVAVIPPEDGYGDKGAPRLQIGGEDSLVYVLDVVAAHAKSATVESDQGLEKAGLPKVTAGAVPGVAVPDGPAPEELVVETVKRGPGAEIRPGRLVAIQYVGALWRDGKVFSSSWSDGRVYASVIGQGLVIKGWDEALVGRTAGSRLMVVAPPDKAYGDADLKVKGLPKYGIKADDTLVYVIDVLGVY
ncbi:FKBP-type peptidyl-prolyl cis-trans isomerase [Actinocorallia populi]|uniref:FKBP-type peptidyl-prolyl cis-trans isomerase n=1 Tax=Actinocorallia populi TaxID=2079200 RepID=UPI0013008693|nr:FKBP-type peptidyl-prolyl cis-trans isomerase [Actinocorallia populi]